MEAKVSSVRSSTTRSARSSRRGSSRSSTCSPRSGSRSGRSSSLVAAFNVSEAPEVLMLLIGGPLFFVVSMIYARVLLELVIAFFRINGNVQEIRDARVGGAPHRLRPRAGTGGRAGRRARRIAPGDRAAPVVSAAAASRARRPRSTSPSRPPSPRPHRQRHATARTAARSVGPRDASARAAVRLDDGDLRELRQRRAGGFAVLRQLRRSVGAGPAAGCPHRRERHEDADLSELRQRGARGRAVLRELQRAVVAG